MLVLFDPYFHISSELTDSSSSSLVVKIMGLQINMNKRASVPFFPYESEHRTIRVWWSELRYLSRKSLSLSSPKSSTHPVILYCQVRVHRCSQAYNRLRIQQVLFHLSRCSQACNRDQPVPSAPIQPFNQPSVSLQPLFNRQFHLPFGRYSSAVLF
jgi:hypothetical protein